MDLLDLARPIYFPRERDEKLRGWALVGGISSDAAQHASVFAARSSGIRFFLAKRRHILLRVSIDAMTNIRFLHENLCVNGV